jgi:predicted amidohydrolase
MVHEAGHAGARLVVFPEKFLNGCEPDLIRSDPQRYAVQRGFTARYDKQHLFTCHA